MIEPLDQRTPPMTPQLAFRVAIVGSIALVLFALIFFRLWFLQVLSGNQYVAQAASNSTRKIPIPAPRGEILSAGGRVLVGSQLVPAIQIAPPDLPTPVTLAVVQHRPVTLPADDYRVFDRLAQILGISTKPAPCVYYVYPGPVSYNPRLAEIPCLVARGVANSPYGDVTIKTDASPYVQYYLAEHKTQPLYQGVQTQQVALRQYPWGTLGAQMFGEIRQVTAKELTQHKIFPGAHSTDVVGQTGLELEYNQYLEGTDGVARVEVNSASEFEGNGVTTQPQAGENLKTSINIGVQRVGEAALAKAISLNPPANSGSFVAMDPDTGQIYAMGSAPTYPPSIFTRPTISTQTYDEYFKGANSPLINRAIASPLPDGSTFKVITAVAALESHVWGADEDYDDTGQFVYNIHEPCTVPGNCLHNAKDASYGPVAMQEALQVSDDVYFYHLGYLLNYAHPEGTTPTGGVLEQWARKFGVGRPTGVDLPGELSGTLPTPNLLTSLYKQELECETGTGAYAYTNGPQVSATKLPGYHKSPKVPKGCGISNKSVATWTVGDNVNTAVGQGDVQITPLQLAVVYAALANGKGAIVTPHIGEDIQSSTGTVLQKIDPAPQRYVQIDPSYRDTILAGLNAAAQQPGGTSYDVMGNFPREVYGKTGTAQEGTPEQILTNTETDYSWYACFVPATATHKPIVVVVSIEKGGFGDVAAAPVARQILSQWFLGRPGKFVVGTSPDT